jgi:hypothetical protein
MKFEDEKGVTLELDAVGYQFPEIKSNYWDSNWLIVHGWAEHPLGAWSFNQACLTTLEVEHLARWLEAIEQPSDLIRPATFLEPLLEFSYVSSPSAAIEIRLTRQCAPPWLTEQDQRSEGIVLSFPADKNSLSVNVNCLREWLARYPTRASRSSDT